MSCTRIDSLFSDCDYFEDCTGENFKIWYVGMVIFTYLVQYEECTCQLPQMKHQTSQEKCKEADLKIGQTGIQSGASMLLC